MLITLKDTISDARRDIGFIKGEKQEIITQYGLRYAGQDATGKQYYWHPDLNSHIGAVHVYVEDFCGNGGENLIPITSFEHLRKLAREFEEYCY